MAWHSPTRVLDRTLQTDDVANREGARHLPIIGRKRENMDFICNGDRGAFLRLIIGGMTKYFVLALLCVATGVSAQVSSGTAFAVAPGLLITNHHVIEGCGSVEIIAQDGRRTGVVVNSDSQIDLALLQSNSLVGGVARLRSPRNIRLGEAVMVFGFPLAGSLSSGGNFTTGVVSGLRGLRDATGEIQITAPVQPGNSGGPIVDASGLIIGVVQAKLDALAALRATGDIPQNVNFGVALEVLADFLLKNKVGFDAVAMSPPLEAAQVAVLAQSFTYRVECRSRTQKSVADSAKKRGGLPACNGSYNAGNWTNCYGEVPTITGGIYYGEFRDDKFHGDGIYAYVNGARFVGGYKDDKRNGFGTEYDSAGSIVRSGFWVNDVFVREK